VWQLNKACLTNDFWEVCCIQYLRGYMQRTQVYFDKETLKLLKQEAKERKTTLARIIREKVEKDMKKKTKLTKKKLTTAEFLLGLAELGEKLKVKAPKDLSQKIDEYIYK
jgi:hypothetical protein